MAQDSYGTSYSTSGGNVPTAGTPIVIHNSDGTKSHGTWMGAAVKN